MAQITNGEKQVLYKTHRYQSVVSPQQKLKRAKQKKHAHTHKLNMSR